jgi:uncharacterized membrane protein
MMLVEGLSLITSISNAVGALLISKGMRGSNATSANLISTTVQTVALLVPLMFSIPELNWQALALFALSGALALGIARLLYFVAMEQIGVAVSSAIIGSNPLISTLLAIVFLSEAVDAATIVGAVLVVGGVFLLSGAGESSVKSRSLFIPFLSAFTYSLANVIRKGGLNVQSEPLLGAVAGAVAGVLCFSIYLVVAGKLGEIKATKRSLGYFIACGLVSAVGWFALMMAMQAGTVAAVTTIVFSYPLFSLVLSWLFLKGEEKINRRIAAGIVVIVAGVVIVSVF